jgi:hypothetical protein
MDEIMKQCYMNDTRKQYIVEVALAALSRIEESVDQNIASHSTTLFNVLAEMTAFLLANAPEEDREELLAQIVLMTTEKVQFFVDVMKMPEAN